MPLVDPVEKIQIYQEFKIDENLLHGAYVALTIRPEPLNVEEGKKLGLLTSLKIARARELARAAGGANDLFDPPPSQLEESEVLSVIKDVFRLQEPTSTPVKYYLCVHRLLTLTSPSQDNSTSASAANAKAKHNERRPCGEGGKKPEE